jgi:hypothetical protein
MEQVLAQLRAELTSQGSAVAPKSEPMPHPDDEASVHDAQSRSRYSARDVAWRVVLVVVLFCAIEAAAFHTRFYANQLRPDTTAGSMLMTLTLEQNRKLAGPNQVLAVGDSRMGIRTRVTDRLAPETGYTLANIATPGAYPRCWYYMLREVDPDRNRYAAVVVPVPELEDDDWGDYSSSEVDLHYLVPLLRVSDAYDFSRSFPTWKLRWRALRAVFLKGLSYNVDFQDLLSNYESRAKALQWNREELGRTRYNYHGPTKSVAGLQVDWAAHKITQYPPDSTDSERHELASQLLRPTAIYTGGRAIYRRLWFGRIINYYRGSRTHVIFLRMPRGPVVRPYPFSTKSSVLREFAAHGQAILLDEHTFDELERPELFMDHMHLNEAGCERFSELLARAVGSALGLPRRAGS